MGGQGERHSCERKIFQTASARRSIGKTDISEPELNLKNKLIAEMLG